MFPRIAAISLLVLLTYGIVVPSVHWWLHAVGHGSDALADPAALAAPGVLAALAAPLLIRKYW